MTRTKRAKARAVNNAQNPRKTRRGGRQNQNLLTSGGYTLRKNLPNVNGLQFRYGLRFKTRHDPVKGDVMVVCGTERAASYAVGSGFWSCGSLDISPAYLAGVFNTPTTANFLQALTECFAEFRFTRMVITCYGIGGTNVAGEYAIGYVADAAMVWTTAALSGSGYSNDSTGFNKCATTPFSMTGPASIPLTNDISAGLDQTWRYTSRIASTSTAVPTATATVALRREEDQGAAVMCFYNGTGTTQQFAVVVEYELELTTLQSNVFTDTVTARRSLQQNPYLESPVYKLAMIPEGVYLPPEEKRDESADEELVPVYVDLPSATRVADALKEGPESRSGPEKESQSWPTSVRTRLGGQSGYDLVIPRGGIPRSMGGM